MSSDSLRPAETQAVPQTILNRNLKLSVYNLCLQAEGGVSPSTLLISRQLAASPKAAMPEHGCSEMPLALCLSPEFVRASQEEPACVDLGLESRTVAGFSDKHGGHGALLRFPPCDS